MFFCKSLLQFFVKKFFRFYEHFVFLNETAIICERIGIRKQKGAVLMSYSLNRINPNQTQVFFTDGRFETLTDEELDDFLSQISLSENSETDSGLTN